MIIILIKTQGEQYFYTCSVLYLHNYAYMYMYCMIIVQL
uniref:Uncharacterized protein n=1 Tax=Amphimedon queenslandica TaxID=400682 RepID=A0A1X7TIF8_AMPQE